MKTVLTHFGDWQRDSEYGSRTRFTLRRDISSMHIRNPASNGQAETGAPEISRTRPVGAVKAVKNMKKIFFRNTDARIGDGDLSAALILGEGDFASASVWS